MPELLGCGVGTCAAVERRKAVEGEGGYGSFFMEAWWVDVGRGAEGGAESAREGSREHHQWRLVNSKYQYAMANADETKAL